jgi:hypothetical protein
MIGYSLYVLLAVGLTMLLTAVFRQLRKDDQPIAPPEEDAAFDRRMAEIEERFGTGQGGKDRADKRK